jgi:transcriptional regulator with XRE-family HTH domain
MALSLKAIRRAKLRELLVQARKDAGFSQVAVAKALSRPQAFVSRHETGETQVEVADLIEIAEALSTDPVTILRKVRKP